VADVLHLTATTPFCDWSNLVGATRLSQWLSVAQGGGGSVMGRKILSTRLPQGAATSIQMMQHGVEQICRPWCLDSGGPAGMTVLCAGNFVRHTAITVTG